MSARDVFRTIFLSTAGLLHFSPCALAASPRPYEMQLHYFEPTDATNVRFADMRETHFGEGRSRARQGALRLRAQDGDGNGFEVRGILELTAFSAEDRRPYDQGEIVLTHEYLGFNVAVGTSCLLTPWLTLYFELGLLAPPLRNVVTLTSGAGRARYEADFNDNSWMIMGNLRLGGAMGLDIHLSEA